MPQAFKPLSVCFDGPFWIYKSTFMTWIRIPNTESFRPKAYEISLIALNTSAQYRHRPFYMHLHLLKAQERWTRKDPKQIVTNALPVRDEPQQLYFLINRDICFIQWKVTSLQQKPTVDCVLCIVWMSMNVVSSVHFQMSSFIQSANNTNIKRKQIFWISIAKRMDMIWIHTIKSYF